MTIREKISRFGFEILWTKKLGEPIKGDMRLKPLEYNTYREEASSFQKFENRGWVDE